MQTLEVPNDSATDMNLSSASIIFGTGLEDSIMNGSDLLEARSQEIAKLEEELREIEEQNREYEVKKDILRDIEMSNRHAIEDGIKLEIIQRYLEEITKERSQIMNEQRED